MRYVEMPMSSTIKRFYFDLETSGLDPKTNAILQLACIMEINGEIKDKLTLFIKPFKTDIVTQEAFEIHGLDPSEDRFISPQKAFVELLKFLDKYINKYDTKDKAYLVGFNCIHFDVRFLYEFFVKNGSQYMYSYFYPETLDVMVLMGYACQGQRHKLGNSKLTTFAESLGIEIEGNAHDAMYDTELTYRMFQIYLNEYPI